MGDRGERRKRRLAEEERKEKGDVRREERVREAMTLKKKKERAKRSPSPGELVPRPR